MKLLTKTLPPDCNIFLFGDEHSGSHAFWQEGFQKMVDMIHGKYAGVKQNFAIGHGDNIEAITYSDYRFDPENFKQLDMLEQAKSAVKNMKLIKKQLLVILDGNHPRALKKYGNLGKHIAEEVGVDFGTYTCRLTYISEKKKEVMFRHFTSHGFGGIGSKAYPRKRAYLNMQLALRRALEDKSGDCILSTMGHTHKLLTCEPDDYLFLTGNGNNLEEWYTSQIKVDQAARFIPTGFRWFGNTGTFRRSFVEGLTDYSEIAGYDPIQLGFLVALVRGGKLVDLRIERV